MKNILLYAFLIWSIFPNNIHAQCVPEIPGYVNIGQRDGHNYYLSLENARPTDAQAAAEALGGYLAVIDDPDEDDFLLSYIDELTYIGLNDANTEGTFEWFNGDPVGYTNIDPCGFCTPNSDDQDYVVKEPWNEGGWSFSNFWNARKYIVEIPCGSATTDCAFFNSIDQSGTLHFKLPTKINETTDGYELIYQRTSFGNRILTKWNINSLGGTISDVTTEIPYPTGMDFGRFSDLGDHFFMHDVDGLNPQLVKVDFTGNIVWTRTYNVNTTISNINYTASRDGWEDADGILITEQLFPNENTFVSFNVLERSSDGGYYLFLKAGNFVKLIKIDSNGNELWTTQFPFLEERKFVGESSDGSAYYITEGDGFLTDNLLLKKINANTGALEWENNLGDYFSLTNTSPFGFRIKGAAPDNNGGVFFNFTLFGDVSENTFQKYGLVDANGNLVWGFELPWQTGNSHFAQFATSDGGYLFTGTESSPFRFVWKYTSQGWNAPVCGTGGGTGGDGITVFNCPSDIDIEAPANNNFTVPVDWAPPIATTDCDQGGLTITQINGPTSGSELGPVSNGYSIVYEITDACGNSELCVFFINVFPEATQVNCPSDITVTATSANGAVVTYDSPTFITSCIPGLPNIISGLPSGSVFPVGTTEVNISVFLNGTPGICQVTENCVFNVTVLPQGGGGGGCPDDIPGFTTIGEFGDSKYYLSNDISRPVDAQVVAESNGGYLVSIGSQEENDFVRQGISELTYIGLTDENVEGQLEWFNGEPLTYDNVNPCGFCQPNAADQDYVVMAPWDGAWSFSNFWNQRKFVMEIPCDGGGGGGDECSFNVTFDSTTPNANNGNSLRVERVKERSGGYELTDFFFSDETFEAYHFLRSKENGSAVSNTTQILNRNPATLNHNSRYWDSENNVLYSLFILGADEVAFFKYDENGTLIWAKNYSNLDYAPSRIKVLSNEIILLATAGPNNFLPAVKVDLNGDFIEEFTFDINVDPGEDGTVIGETSTGGYYVAYTEGGPFVAKTDGQGNQIWKVNNGTGDPPSEKRAFIGFSGDGSNLYFRRNSFNSFKGFLSVFDESTGTLSWSITAGAAYANGSNAFRSSIRNVIPTDDGGAVVFYQYHLGFAPAPFIYIHERFDADGNLVWTRNTPEDVLDLVGYGIQAEDGGFIFGSNPLGDSDWIILRMTSDGNFDPDCGGGGTQDQPDLTVSNITNFPPSGNVGDVIFFEFDLNNIGMATATGDYNVNSYISTDQTFSSDDVLAGEVPTGGTPVGTINVPGAITVPNLPDGNYYLILAADSNNEITESNENNNTLAVPFEIGSSGGGGCPTSLAGYTSLGEFGSSAYFLSNDVSRPVDAQAAAESVGGNLVTIDSQGENDFLYPQINELVYIGLNDFSIENTIEWFSGDPVNYTNFDICGFCNANSESMDFVVMHSWNGGWSWSNFFNNRKSIVEIPCTSNVNNQSINNTLITFVNPTENVSLLLENVYPNPTEKFLFATIQSQKEQTVDVQVFDARGSMKIVKTVDLKKGENVIEISVAEFPAGFYTILIPQAQGKNSAKRFMKIRD